MFRAVQDLCAAANGGVASQSRYSGRLRSISAALSLCVDDLGLGHGVIYGRRITAILNEAAGRLIIMSSPFDDFPGKVSIGRTLGRSALSIGAAIAVLILLGSLAIFVLL